MMTEKNDNPTVDTPAEATDMVDPCPSQSGPSQSGPSQPGSSQSGSSQSGSSQSGMDVSLPVMGGGGASASGGGGARRKPSTMGRWRAMSLVAVHIAMLAHAIHYLAKGETLSPIEPSESMYTLELGQVNAGFIFFAIAILLTLIFGRSACGWACHLIAYQDLCGWLMKKIGIRPKAFRSRLLVFIPLGVALYMFVWPNVKRLLFKWDRFAEAVAASPEFLGLITGGPPVKFPGWSDHIVTDAYWKTFPGPVFAVLTVFVCGFAVIYFLGAKGFCTYACPYGGFFGVAEKLSPLRIRVTDACRHCAHCTASCTSNVLIHQEVKLYGMVVDPGCMKCMDCVSVCPNDALYLGVGPPAIAKGRPKETPTPRRYDFTLGEELILLLVFLVATPAYRGLYNGPPLLMALPMGAITAFCAMKLWRMWRDPTVRLQNLKLKVGGSLKRSGLIFAACTIGWFVFTAHSGIVQWNLIVGRLHMRQIQTPPEMVFAGQFQPGLENMGEAASSMMQHFETANQWSLFETLELKRGLAWVYLLKGDAERTEELCREAIALQPDLRELYVDLMNVLQYRGKGEEWLECYRNMLENVYRNKTKTEDVEHAARDHFVFAGTLTSLGRIEEAVEQYRACIALRPDAQEALFNLGGLLGRSGQFEEAIRHLQAAELLQPDDVDTKVELALALNGAGRVSEAVSALQAAIRLDPTNEEPRMLLRAMRASFQGRE